MEGQGRRPTETDARSDFGLQCFENVFDRAKLAVREAKLAEESVTGLTDCRSCSRSCETISVNRDIAGFAERAAVVTHRNCMFRCKSCELQVSSQELCQAV